MIDMKKNVYQAIHTVEPSDALYDSLPRLTGEKNDEIYTIQYIPARYYQKMENNKRIKVETSVPVIRIFLVFGINNNLYPNCIETGKCVIHPYDTIAVVTMDENYRMDAFVEFYYDLTMKMNSIIMSERSIASSSRFYGDVNEAISFIPYSEMYSHNQTAPAIDKQITDVQLIGGYENQDVESYDPVSKTRLISTQKVEVHGILEKINEKLIHR